MKKDEELLNEAQLDLYIANDNNIATDQAAAAAQRSIAASLLVIARHTVQLNTVQTVVPIHPKAKPQKGIEF